MITTSRTANVSLNNTNISLQIATIQHGRPAWSRPSTVLVPSHRQGVSSKREYRVSGGDGQSADLRVTGLSADLITDNQLALNLFDHCFPSADVEQCVR